MPGFLVPSPTAPLQLMPMASVESTILVALILDSALFSSVWSCPYFTFLCLGFTRVSLLLSFYISLSLSPQRTLQLQFCGTPSEALLITLKLKILLF